MNKEKICNLLLFILIFFVTLSIIIIKPLDNLDEIWNYNFARNISDGLVPYKDFNMVITPLLCIINGIVLKITFNELIVMRILAAILCSTIIYITYEIFRILDVKKEVAIIFTFFIGYLFKDIFCIDYNYLSLLIALIIIYIEIKLYQKDDQIIKYNRKKDLILGILAGLTILTKQTTGILICLALLGNKLIFIRNKEQVKIWLKSFLHRLLGIMIPIVLFILYLIINNAFLEFINYTILGIIEFTNNISYIKLIKWNLIGILSVSVPIVILYEWIKTICFEKDKKTYFLLVYGLAMFVVCFPISDKIHFVIGALPIIIAMLYEMHMLVKKVDKIIIRFISEFYKFKLFVLLMLNSIIILSLIYYLAINLNNYFLKIEYYSNLKHFTYIPIDSGLKDQISNIDKYIEKNENLRILDSSAAIYMIPLDIYNKDYDMFNKGNLGYKGEEKTIKEISESNNIKYLILKDEYLLNWQTPIEVIDYVKNNRIKTGEIEKFYIYE